MSNCMRERESVWVWVYVWCVGVGAGAGVCMWRLVTQFSHASQVDRAHAAHAACHTHLLCVLCLLFVHDLLLQTCLMACLILHGCAPASVPRDLLFLHVSATSSLSHDPPVPTAISDTVRQSPCLLFVHSMSCHAGRPAACTPAVCRQTWPSWTRSSLDWTLLLCQFLHPLCLGHPIFHGHDRPAAHLPSAGGHGHPG